MKLEVTKPQLRAMLSLVDDIDMMIGCGERDDIWVKNIKAVDRMLKKNGIKYEFMASSTQNNKLDIPPFIGELPDDCQSEEDGICSLPRGTCKQCAVNRQ